MRPSDVFPQLDAVLSDGDPARAIDFLIGHFLATKEYGRFFEARLMKMRQQMGLPLIQTAEADSAEYQTAVTAAARETGTLFLADGNIERAWPFFRAIGEPHPVYAAIACVQPADGIDGVIGIAFQEGVHPLKGLELILEQYGMCRAITLFGMQQVTKDRERCIALLAKHLHAEIIRRMGGSPNAGLPGLLAAAEPFGEWDSYVDASHLFSVIPYCTEVTDTETLRVFSELCEYGSRLAPQFRQPGIPPFEDQCEAYRRYIARDTGYFYEQMRIADPEIAGDAPARTLVRLLMSMGRENEALDVLLEHVHEDAPYGVPVPSALELCSRTKAFGKLRELSRERGDLLSYAASAILSKG